MPCLLSKKTSADIPTGVFFLLFKASVVICTRKPLSISSVWSAGLQNTSRIISLLILFYLILPERKICNVILCAEGKRNFKSQLSPGFPCGTESLNAPKRGNSKARKKYIFWQSSQNGHLSFSLEYSPYLMTLPGCTKTYAYLWKVELFGLLCVRKQSYWEQELWIWCRLDIESIHDGPLITSQSLRCSHS